MAVGANYVVKYRRRREKKTNYRRRLALLKSGKVRLVIRKKNNNIIVQFIKYKEDGDITLVHKESKDLKKIGYKGHANNLPASYLTGYIAGKEALNKGIKEAIVDAGIFKPVKKGAVYACVKGVIDAGVKVPCSEEVLPKEDRIKGKHIEDYAKSLDEEKYKRQFSLYLKNGLDPRNFVKHFEEILNKVK